MLQGASHNVQDAERRSAGDGDQTRGSSQGHDQGYSQEVCTSTSPLCVLLANSKSIWFGETCFVDIPVKACFIILKFESDYYCFYVLDLVLF